MAERRRVGGISAKHPYPQDHSPPPNSRPIDLSRATSHARHVTHDTSRDANAELECEQFPVGGTSCFGITPPTSDYISDDYCCLNCKFRNPSRSAARNVPTSNSETFSVHVMSGHVMSFVHSSHTSHSFTHSVTNRSSARRPDGDTQSAFRESSRRVQEFEPSRELENSRSERVIKPS